MFTGSHTTAYFVLSLRFSNVGLRWFRDGKPPLASPSGLASSRPNSQIPITSCAPTEIKENIESNVSSHTERAAIVNRSYLLAPPHNILCLASATDRKTWNYTAAQVGWMTFQQTVCCPNLQQGVIMTYSFMLSLQRQMLFQPTKGFWRNGTDRCRHLPQIRHRDVHGRCCAHRASCPTLY